MQRCIRGLVVIAVLVVTTMLPAYAYHRGLPPAGEPTCTQLVNAGASDAETCPRSLPHRDHCCHAYAHFLAAVAAIEPAGFAHPDVRQIVLATLMPRGVSLPPPTHPPKAAPA